MKGHAWRICSSCRAGVTAFRNRMPKGYVDRHSLPAKTRGRARAVSVPDDQEDLGVLKCARRTEIGDGWFLYESKRPYQPNLKFRNTLVNEPFGAPESSIQFEMGCEAYGSPLLPWRQYGYLGDA